MKSSNQIENPLCTSIENLIVKLLSKFQSDPCNNVKVISLLKKMSYYKAKCMLFLSY